MPTIGIKRNALHKALGKKYTEEEFSDLCFEFGLELDDVVEELEKTEDEKTSVVYKIEVPANRYDLLCLEGLARALLIFIAKIQIPSYYKLTPKSQLQKLVIQTSTKDIRPFCVAAILRNIKFTTTRYERFIELQDKLHQNICRKRTLVAIGTHDLDTIEGPFSYEANAPAEIKFKALNQKEEKTAVELMELYSTDSHLKPYLPIIRDKPRYPVIYDKNRVVLSMPPIINGEHSKITPKTTNVFIECTATDLTKVIIVLDILVCMFSEYCSQPFFVEPVEVVGSDGMSTIYPLLHYRQQQVDVSYISNLLGVQISGNKLAMLLKKMGFEGHLSKTKATLQVEVPPTRPDIMHQCDIAEETAVAYGYNNIPMTLPKAVTIAKQVPLNKMCDQVREQVAQAGFTEALTFSLCSKDDITTKIRKPEDSNAVVIANPKTVDFQVARTTLIPGILKTIAANKMMPLPLKLFEVGDIIRKCSTKDVGAQNERRLCTANYNKSSGFEVIHGLLDRIMQILEIPFSEDKTDKGYFIRALEKDESYLPGRCANIIVNGSVVGSLGVIHPEVMLKFELTLPCAVMEINLEPFL